MNMRWLFLSEDDGSIYDYGEKKRNARMDSSSEFDLENKIENAVAGKRGILLVSSGKLTHFTVSRCTDTQMFQARHARASELNPSTDRIYVRLDAAQRGMGTGSCGKYLSIGAHSLSVLISTYFLTPGYLSWYSETLCTWPHTLPEYFVNGGKYEMSFWIKPIGFHSSK